MCEFFKFEEKKTVNKWKEADRRIIDNFQDNTKLSIYKKKSYGAFVYYLKLSMMGYENNQFITYCPMCGRNLEEE